MKKINVLNKIYKIIFYEDLCDFEEDEDFEFIEDEPPTPFENLLTILPSDSSNLLPNSYGNV